MKIFSYLRVLYRAPIALLWTMLVHFAWIRVVQLFRPGKRCLGALRVWGYGLSRIMGIRLKMENECPMPMGDLIIANHMGFLDIPALLSCFPAVFIIKGEMRRVFFFGKPLVDQGHLFVDRNMLSALANSLCHVMFQDGNSKSRNAGESCL